MATTHGIEFVIGVPAVDDFDDRIDEFYSSLAGQISIVSIDLAWNEEKGSLAVLLGVTSPDGLNPQSIVVPIATDAIKRALRHSGLVELDDEVSPAPSARVLEFA